MFAPPGISTATTTKVVSPRKMGFETLLVPTPNTAHLDDRIALLDSKERGVVGKVDDIKHTC